MPDKTEQPQADDGTAIDLSHWAAELIEAATEQQAGWPLQSRTGLCRPRHSAKRCPEEADTEVYARLFEFSYELDEQMPAGRYLRRRGIDPELAAEHGLVQTGAPSELFTELLDEFGRERLNHAGLLSRGGSFLFNHHHLLCFYFDDGWPRYVQGRDITGESGVKELSLCGLHSPVPFNVELLADSPHTVYLCEGVIDTLSALQLDYPAMGVPGVHGFRSEWFDRFAGVRRVRLVFDADEAGQRGAARLRDAFRKRGITAEAFRPRNSNDFNDLLRSK